MLSQDAYVDKRVIVTGASGFIGSHLAKELSRRGAIVLGIGRSFPPSPNVLSANVLYERLDVLDSAPLVNCFLRFRPEVVFHLAAHPDGRESFAQMRACLRQNTDSVLNVLEAAESAGAGTFILGDSSKVYGNTSLPYAESLADGPICSYAIAKAAAWRLCLAYSAVSKAITVAGLRPTLVYGPGQGLNLISYVSSGVLEGKSIVIQGGSQTRDPLYIDDAVDAYVRLGVCGSACGHAIPVGGGRELPVSEICALVVKAFGVDADLRFNSSDVRATEIFRSSCDNRDALRLLDWRPRTSLEDGLARLAAECRSSVSATAVAV